MHRRFRAVILILTAYLPIPNRGGIRLMRNCLLGTGVAYRGEHHQNVLGVSYRLATEFYKNAFHISAPVEELMGRRAEIATEFFANRVGLFPSAKATLERLRGMKLCLALATSSVSASARPFERTGIRDFFDVVVTGDEIERGKPHPDIYLVAAEKLQVNSNSCLVIEDALAGIAAAKAANMRVAAIPDSRFVDPREYSKEADYVLPDLSEIPALVDQVDAAACKD